jgi:hypothetical protein
MSLLKFNLTRYPHTDQIRTPFRTQTFDLLNHHPEGRALIGERAQELEGGVRAIPTLVN